MLQPRLGLVPVRVHHRDHPFIVNVFGCTPPSSATTTSSVGRDAQVARSRLPRSTSPAPTYPTAARTTAATDRPTTAARTTLPHAARARPRRRGRAQRPGSRTPTFSRRSRRAAPPPGVETAEAEAEATAVVAATSRSQAEGVAKEAARRRPPRLAAAAPPPSPPEEEAAAAYSSASRRSRSATSARRRRKGLHRLVEGHCGSTPVQAAARPPLARRRRHVVQAGVAPLQARAHAALRRLFRGQGCSRARRRCRSSLVLEIPSSACSSTARRRLRRRRAAARRLARSRSTWSVISSGIVGADHHPRDDPVRRALPVQIFVNPASASLQGQLCGNAKAQRSSGSSTGRS